MPQATPGARKLAKELGVDLDNVQGSGKSGYIVEADVRRMVVNAPNGRPEQGPPFTHEMKEDFDGEVYPVSELYKMRFRQDDPVTGDMVGEDLLAIRPKAAGGKFRSHDGVLGFFVADRGYFGEPAEVKPKDEPDETGHRPALSEPTTDAADSFAVSE
ncbi:hypothetical protein LCGC14_0490880 [marine sediment metagenome]|uniref:Peripheral subunit-binding (PSBD) domain-containing protein n=1 Tax=marine sediment metagenome TaxID=412755 RepID=A0A0F9S6H8_9ZZZZ